MNKRQLLPSDAETYCSEYNCTVERFNEIKEQFNSGFFIIREDYKNPYTATAVEVDFEVIADAVRGCSQIRDEHNKLSIVMDALMDGLNVDSFWQEDKNSYHGFKIAPQSNYYCCGMSLDKCVVEYQLILNDKLLAKIEAVEEELKSLKLKRNQLIK